MRANVAAALTVVALGACARAPDSESSFTETDASLQASLLQKEQQMMDAIALGDTSVWLANLHDSCLIAVEDGSTTTKHELVGGLRPLPSGYVGKIHVIEPRFRRYGNAAVVSFVADEYLDLYGQRIHTQYRQSDTWMRFGDQWQVVSMQVFEIPANPNPITLDASILQRYAGTYELAADKRCEITLEGGKLVAHKADRAPQELLAETENVFFRPNDGRVRVIFDDGTMIERRAGQDLRWRRVE
jgi:Domain of unknown function (DUF4440)/Domain of unknown function (DUF3471)